MILNFDYIDEELCITSNDESVNGYDYNYCYKCKCSSEMYDLICTEILSKCYQLPDDEYGHDSIVDFPDEYYKCFMYLLDTIDTLNL